MKPVNGRSFFAITFLCMAGYILADWTGAMVAAALYLSMMFGALATYGVVTDALAFPHDPKSVKTYAKLMATINEKRWKKELKK